MKKAVLLLSLTAILFGCNTDIEVEDPGVEDIEEDAEAAGEMEETELDQDEAASDEETENDGEEVDVDNIDEDENENERADAEEELEEREANADADPRSTDIGVIPQYIERQAGINADNDEVYSIIASHYNYSGEDDGFLIFSYQLMYLQFEDEIRPVMMLENYWEDALTNLHAELTVETTDGDVLIDSEEIFFSYEEFGVIEPGQAIPYYPALSADEEVIEILEAIHENPQVFRCTYSIISADEIEAGEEYSDSGYVPSNETTNILRPVDNDSFELISVR